MSYEPTTKLVDITRVVIASSDNNLAFCFNFSTDVKSLYTLWGMNPVSCMLRPDKQCLYLTYSVVADWYAWK